MDWVSWHNIKTEEPCSPAWFRGPRTIKHVGVCLKMLVTTVSYSTAWDKNIQPTRRLERCNILNMILQLHQHLKLNVPSKTMLHFPTTLSTLPGILCVFLSFHFMHSTLYHLSFTAMPLPTYITDRLVLWTQNSLQTC